MGYILIRLDELRGDGGDESKLEESESVLDTMLSRELLPLNQHLFFFIILNL